MITFRAKHDTASDTSVLLVIPNEKDHGSYPKGCVLVLVVFLSRIDNA